MNRFALAVAGVGFVVVFCASSAVAAPILFTYTSTGSGTLDGTPFADSAFTIIAQGDTDNRLPPEFGTGWNIEHDTASIEIAGLGTMSFVTGTRTFVSNFGHRAGFSRAVDEGGTDLLVSPSNPALADWDMLSSVGPLSGNGYAQQWDDSPIVTSLGVLVFDSNYSMSVTFQAVVDQAPIPAPGAILLTTFGAGLLGWLRRRRAL